MSFSMYNMNITELKLGSTMGYQGGLVPVFLGYADRLMPSAFYCK